MPKFKPNLRREANVRKVPYKKQKCEREPRATQLDPRPLDLRISEINLANDSVPEVSVGCWLDTKKLKWGRYNDQDTAILHLTIEANHPSNVEVGEFRIDLAFSSHQTAGQPSSSQSETQHPVIGSPETTPQSSQEATQSPPPAQTDEPSTTPTPSCTQKEIELHGKPAPSTVFFNQQSPWNFSGHRVAAQSGRASIARWIWSAQEPKCSVTHCGGLYCGCIIKHGGPTQPISIMYRIEGEARENTDSEVAHRYKFRSEPQKSFPWLLTPGQASHELTDDEVERLNEEVLRKYGVGQVNRVEAQAARPRYEGSADGHGTLVQGDVHFGGTYYPRLQ